METVGTLLLIGFVGFGSVAFIALGAVSLVIGSQQPEGQFSGMTLDTRGTPQFEGCELSKIGCYDGENESVINRFYNIAAFSPVAVIPLPPA